MNRDTVRGRGLAQPIQVLLGAAGIKEHLAAVIAALDHMNGVAGQKYAGAAGHG